ncbi:MAG: hypothetical protein Q8R02_08725 [Hyphomonadaceae bacterium]|nr:hypothetical protein [Hyphomonadaceae bacterium]
MTTKALKSTAGARIHRRVRNEPCEVEFLMREAAACWRLPAKSISVQIGKLPARDRSEITPEFTRKRLTRRITALETLASEGNPTSAIGVAYPGGVEGDQGNRLCLIAVGGQSAWIRAD